MSLNKQDGVPRCELRRHERRAFNQVLAAGLAEVNAKHRCKSVIEQLRSVEGVTILTKDEEE